MSIQLKFGLGPKIAKSTWKSRQNVNRETVKSQQTLKKTWGRLRKDVVWHTVMDHGWPTWIKPGSLWSITEFHSNSLCWNLCEITFTKHLEDGMNNKVMKSNKNKISRTAKRMVSFEELQDLRWLSDWREKGDGKFKLNKYLVNEKIVLVLCVYWWFCLEHLRMRYWHY